MIKRYMPVNGESSAYMVEVKGGLYVLASELEEVVKLLRELDNCHSFGDCMRVNQRYKEFLVSYKRDSSHDTTK